MNEPLQISRAVLGFPRRVSVRSVVAVALLIAALTLIDPQWSAQAVAAAGRWLGRFWLPALLTLAGFSLLLVRRQRRFEMALGRRPRTPRLPLLVHVALLLGAASIAAIVIGALLWEILGLPDPGSPTGSVTGTQATLDAVKVVLTVVAGIGAVVALTIAYRKQRLGEVSAYVEDSKMLLDRYCKAAELLGSADACVRTAGVYAFAALANDAPEARQGCIDVLCAYMRQPYSPPGSTVTTAETARDPWQEQQVRLTIIRLIRDNLHLSESNLRSWRGHDFNFSGATFDGGDFTGATFSGSGFVNLSNTSIVGPLSLARARFAGGVVSFDGARLLEGGSISLHGAVFRGGVVDLSKMGEGAVITTSKLGLSGTAPSGLRLPEQRVAQS